MLQSTPRSKVHCLLFTFNPLSLQLLTGASLRALFHLFSVTFSAALLITTTAFKCSRLTNGRSFSCCQIQVLALVSRVASYLKKFEGVSENFVVCRNTFNTNTQACQHEVTQLWLWAQEHLPTLKTSWQEDHSDELCLKVAKAAYFIQRMNRRARELCKATSEQVNSNISSKTAPHHYS